MEHAIHVVYQHRIDVDSYLDLQVSSFRVPETQKPVKIQEQFGRFGDAVGFKLLPGSSFPLRLFSSSWP